MFEDNYKEILLDVKTNDGGRTVVITLTCDDGAISNEDMLTALEQFIDDTDRGEGETIQ